MLFKLKINCFRRLSAYLLHSQISNRIKHNLSSFLKSVAYMHNFPIIQTNKKQNIHAQGLTKYTVLHH